MKNTFLFARYSRATPEVHANSVPNRLRYLELHSEFLLPQVETNLDRGVFFERIDLHVEVTPVKIEELTTTEQSKQNSADIRERVLRAREIQAERFKGLKDIYSNAQMPSRMVHEVCQLTDSGLTLLKTAMERLQLSARTFDRILKVARTAADLGSMASGLYFVQIHPQASC